MIKSEQINELATALSKAQAEMKGAIKDSKNPFFKSSYADLSSVWDACRGPLTKNGLSIVQTNCGDSPETLTVCTTLLHSSGQWISSQLTGKPVKNDPQAIGSAYTYYRRYALAAMVGVSPEDDDGNSAYGSYETASGEIEIKTKIYDNSENESQKTQEAKKKDADPLNNKYLNGKWKKIMIHFGKNKGKKLGELPATTLRWYRDEWKPQPYKGVIDDMTLDLEEALKAYAIERQIEKDRAQVDQEVLVPMKEGAGTLRVIDDKEKDEIPF